MLNELFILIWSRWKAFSKCLPSFRTNGRTNGLLPSAFCLLTLTAFLPALADAQSNGRIDSEYRYAVPEDQVDELWDYMKTAFSKTALAAVDSSLSSWGQEEDFFDLYFDTPEKTLLKNDAGIRFRRRYLRDSLLKTLVQLKMAGNDSSGRARREIKFKAYDSVKKKDRRAMHPFWRHIRPKDRDAVNQQLATFRITGDDLREELKLKQTRRRMYISENGESLMTFTLDRVAAYRFPFPSFTDLELEINEIRFSQAGFAERKRLEEFSRQIRDQILNQFPELKQDQRSKYQKMYERLEGNVLANLADNFSYILLAGIACFAVFLFVKRK